MFPKTEVNRKLAQRIFLNDLDECLRFPKYFEIETVNACNARCTICPIMTSERPRGFMAPELFNKFVDEVAEHQDWIETICVSRDGEPTLDKNIPARVAALKNAGIKKVTLTTNVERLTADLAKDLIAAGLDDIMLSIDAVTEDVYRQIRIGLNFESVRSNAIQLFRLRNEAKSPMTIRVRMVITDVNKHQVDDWLAFWHAHAAPTDNVYAMPEHSWGNQCGSEDPEKVERFAKQPCVFLFSSMAMHVDGVVGLCNVDYNTEHVLGDFKTQSIKEIWNGEPYNEARRLHAHGRRNEIGFCRGCDLWERTYRS